MAWKRIAWMVGILLLMATTALEVFAWWNTQEQRARQWYTLVSALNVLAIVLLVIADQ